MYEVIMPKLGITMESGRIEKWHKNEGDRVETGEVLFEVMTDKVTIEVESYHSGILKKILRSEGEEVPVTEVVAYIGEKDEKIPADKIGKKDSGKHPREKTHKINDKDNIRKKTSGTGNKRVKISPLARKTAKQEGIDYIKENIKGSGPGGRIEKKDIIEFVDKNKKDKSKVKKSERERAAVKSSVELGGMRKLIAERMSYSGLNIPHIILNAKANVSRLTEFKAELRERIFKDTGIKITYTDLILKSVASALRNHLELNATYSEGKYIIYEDINIGLAVSIKNGLIVPVIFKCDRMAIKDIAVKRAGLVGKAVKGKLELDEISGGTFTVTNLGMYGVRSFSPIINPPQVAILAVGEIYKGPGLADNRIVPQSFVNISVSCDHRVIDGKTGALFLREVTGLLENPSKLID